MTPEQWERFDELPKGVSVDPHDRKPFMIVWFAIDPRNRVIVFEEFPPTSFHETPSPYFGVSGYADLIRATEAGDNFHEHQIKNIVWRVMDPSFGRTRSASSGRTLQDEFSDFGLSFDCTVDNDITAGHLAVRQMLDEPPRLFITSNCKNVIQAFERYTYQDFPRVDTELRKKEAPREEYKDAMDVIRYMAMSNPFYFDPTQQVLDLSGNVRNMGLGR
jgi:hypothetical protein